MLGDQCKVLEPAPTKGHLKITDLNHVTCLITNMRAAIELYRALFGFEIDTFQGPTPMLRVGSGNQQFILLNRKHLEMGGFTGSKILRWLEAGFWRTKL